MQYIVYCGCERWGTFTALDSACYYVAKMYQKETNITCFDEIYTEISSKQRIGNWSIIEEEA